MRLGNSIVFGSLHHAANTATQIASGTTAARPGNAVGLIRYNTDEGHFETNDGTGWSNVGSSSSSGTVTSVGLTGVDGAITVTGSPITEAGTFVLGLAGELAGVNAITTTGLVTRTAAGTYSAQALAASAVAGEQGIAITNGDGVAGAPTIGLSFAGLAAAGVLSNTATIIVNDGTDNLKATLTQLATMLDSGFVLQTGDTMTGPLILAADPATALAASTKSYVDNTATTAANAAAGAAAAAAQANSVQKVGDTMTGSLTLNADPTAPLHASTKGYTDNTATTAATAAAGAVQANAVLKSGSTMTGLLILSSDPAAPLGAATKSYVDNSISTAGRLAGNGLTLTGNVLSVNTSGVTTAIVANNVVVRSSGIGGQVLLSSATAGAEGTWGAVNLASANAVTGILPIASGGTGSSSVANARVALGAAGVFRAAFTSADIVAGLLTVTHNLGQQFVSVAIYDNNNLLIQPDEITMTSNLVSTVNFTSYGVLPGTWNIVVVG